MAFPPTGITPSEAVAVLNGFDDGGWPRWDQLMYLLGPASLRVPGIAEVQGVGGRLPHIQGIDPDVYRPDIYFRRCHAVRRRLEAAARLWDTLRDALPAERVGHRTRADFLESARSDLLRLVLGVPDNGPRILAEFEALAGARRLAADHAASADGSVTLGASVAVVGAPPRPRPPPSGGGDGGPRVDYESPASDEAEASSGGEDNGGTPCGVGDDARAADLNLFGRQVERAVLDLRASAMTIRAGAVSRNWTDVQVLQERMFLVMTALGAVDRWIQAHGREPESASDGDDEEEGGYNARLHERVDDDNTRGWPGDQ